MAFLVNTYLATLPGKTKTLHFQFLVRHISTNACIVTGSKTKVVLSVSKGISLSKWTITPKMAEGLVLIEYPLEYFQSSGLVRRVYSIVRIFLFQTQILWFILACTKIDKK